MTTSTTPAPFGRVITAMATPFGADGAVDYDAAVRLAEHLIAHGNDGLVVAGSTGESVTLTQDEKLRLFRAVSGAVGGRAKILAGVGSPSTMDTVDMVEKASDTGVDGLLIVTPAYNKPSQEGLYQHFLAAAMSTDLPIMLYNVPGRTSVNMEAATVLRLAEVSNIVALKEAGKLEQAGDILAAAPPNFAVYSGADEVNLPILALGGVGVVSVVGHVVGDDLQAMHRAFFGGDLVTASRLHLKTLAMTRAMFSVPNPVPTKTALAMLGVLESPRVRLPLVDADDDECDVIRTALEDYGLC